MSTETTDAHCDLEPSGEPGPPERLGRYRVLRGIGRGASATVYEALDTRMGRRVALKVLQVDPNLSTERRTAQIERFDREARAIAHLSHPNIVFVYDVGEDCGRHYLVMELLEGVTLRERLTEGGPIAPDEAMSIIDQMALALDSTHAEGIVHRDIKPSNVLLLPDGRVKMLDFGIARSGDDISVTHTGVVIGSPAYMSPEQSRGEAVTPASDIWSLGALVYEMLAGEPAFSGPNIVAVLHQIGYDQPSPLRGDIADANRVVARAMAKLPDLRYASAGELAADLHAALHDPVQRFMVGTSSETDAATEAAPVIVASRGQQSEPTASEPPVTVRRRSRRRLRRLLADLALIVAWAAIGIGVLSILALRMRHDQSTIASMPTPAPASSDHLVLVPAAAPSTVVAPRSLAPAALAVQPATTQVARPEPLQPVATGVRVRTPVLSMPKLPRIAVTGGPQSREVARVTSHAAEPARVALLTPRRERPSTVAVALAPTSAAVHRAPAQTSLQAAERHTAPDISRRVTTPEATGDGPGRFRADTLLGRWNGNIWKDRATLLVKSADAGAFSGIATVSTGAGEAQVPVTGTFSSVTGRITFWAAGPAGGAASHYDVGQESGRLLDGGLMGGLGLNDGHKLYTWSLSR